MVTIEEMREFLTALANDAHARANPALDPHTLELTRDARAHYAEVAEMCRAIEAELATR